MPKPTESTEWASASTLKTDPDPTKKSFGWSTSDNTLTGIFEKPNLNQQNAWQDNVDQWKNWIDGNFPNDLGGDEFGIDQVVDHWEWDTARFNQLDSVNGVRMYDFIQTASGNLRFERLAPASIEDNNSLWADFEAEYLYGSMYYELYDMFNSGLAIKLNDGSGATYIIGNRNPRFTDNNNIILSGGLVQAASSNRKLICDISTSGPDIYVRRESGGSFVEDTDFSNFNTLTSANFVANNPDGIRVVSWGTIGLDATTGNHSDIARPRKRWIKPSFSTQTIPNTISSKPHWPIDFEPGKKYRVRYHMVSPSMSTSRARVPVYNNGFGDSGQEIGWYSTLLNSQTLQIDFQFTGRLANPPSGIRGVALSQTDNLSHEGPAGGYISDIYSKNGEPSYLNGNILVAEEVD